jgi:signal transduction histidine kinase
MIRRGKLAQLGQLTATVAHEIRNPLGAVKTATFVLERKLKGAITAVNAAKDYADTIPASTLSETGDAADLDGAASKPSLAESYDGIVRMLDVDSQMQRINTGISRCDKIISELLDFARSRSLNIRPMPVDDWVGSIVDEEAEVLSSAVKVIRDFGLGGAQASFDADQMRRVLVNLISNASEAMVGKGKDLPSQITANPTITVTTRRVAGNVEVIVSDNGPGISQENISRIREPLFTTKSFGVGLGIPAIEKILEMHGGGLKIESEVGNGARMTAWFPISQAEEKAA